MVRSNFNTALEASERLNLDEKEALLEVLRHRASEERRAQIKQDIAQANREHARGQCKPATPAQIMRDLTK